MLEVIRDAQFVGFAHIVTASIITCVRNLSGSAFEVNFAVLGVLSMQYGAEYAHVAHAMTQGNLADCLTVGLQGYRMAHGLVPMWFSGIIAKYGSAVTLMKWLSKL